LETAVEGYVGANLFAQSNACVRINSHLRGDGNPMKNMTIPWQLRFLGLFGNGGEFSAPIGTLRVLKSQLYLLRSRC